MGLEFEVRLGLGRGGVDGGRLVELEGVLAVESEIGLGRAAGGGEGRRRGGQVEVSEDGVYRPWIGEEDEDARAAGKSRGERARTVRPSGVGRGG